jgi:hypothetical protein
MATHETPAPVLTPEIQAILKELVTASVTAAMVEARKPLPPTEKELAEIAQAQAHREANAAGVIAAIKNKRFVQEACVHEHSKAAGGGTHCVWVKEEDPRSPGYIYCQKCEARIRPNNYDKDGLPYQRDRNAHYDTDLFNRLFQDCGEQTGVLMG